jgi:hypothetical protein
MGSKPGVLAVDADTGSVYTLKIASTNDYPDGQPGLEVVNAFYNQRGCSGNGIRHRRCHTMAGLANPTEFAARMKRSSWPCAERGTKSPRTAGT